MNKNELKKVLRPLIKECIKEVIFEEGTLSTIISEVVKGTSGKQVVYETKRPKLESDEEAKTVMLGIWSKSRRSGTEVHRVSATFTDRCWLYIRF